MFFSGAQGQCAASVSYHPSLPDPEMISCTASVFGIAFGTQYQGSYEFP